MNKLEIDYILHSVPDLLRSTKNNEFKKILVETSAVLLKFMKDNGLLINVDPFDENGTLNLDVEYLYPMLRVRGLNYLKRK